MPRQPISPTRCASRRVSPATALRFIEQLWNTDLTGFDVDGPLPSFDPVVGDTLISQGRAGVRQFAKDPVAQAHDWRARAEAGNLTAREVVIEVTGRQSFVGSPDTVAAKIVKVAKGLGVSRFDLKYSLGTLPHEQLRDSIELYGTKVAPLVREQLA